MKKQLSKFVGAAILLTAAVAWGQVPHQMQVTVPFSFMAGGKDSPAGDYRVQVDRSQDLVTLSSDHFKTFTLTTSTFRPGSSRSYLRFQRYGEHWFLQTVTLEGVSQNLPVGKRQRDLMIAEKSSGAGPLIADIAIH